MRANNEYPSRDGTFRGLTRIEFDFVWAEMQIDRREEEAAAHGQQIDYDSSFYDNDNSWWEHPEILAKEEQTQEEIESTRKQVLEMADSDTQRVIEERLGNMASAYERELYSDTPKLSEVDRAVQEREQRIKDLNDFLDNATAGEIEEYRRSLRSGTSRPNANTMGAVLSGDE